MSVREAQQRIDSREFAEWMAFYELEPFDADRMELQLARIAAFWANSFRGKGQPPFDVGDFMITQQDKPDRGPMSADQMMSAMNTAMAAQRRGHK